MKCGRWWSSSSFPRSDRRRCPRARAWSCWGGSALGRRFLEVSARTPLQFVEEEFENDVVRAGLLFFNGMREIDLQAPGFGHAIPALLAGRHAAQMCPGRHGPVGAGLGCRHPRAWRRGPHWRRAAGDPHPSGAGGRRRAGRRRADRDSRLCRLRAEPAADLPGLVGRGRGVEAGACAGRPLISTTGSRPCSP